MIEVLKLQLAAQLLAAEAGRVGLESIDRDMVKTAKDLVDTLVQVSTGQNNSRPGAYNLVVGDFVEDRVNRLVAAFAAAGVPLRNIVLPEIISEIIRSVATVETAVSMAQEQELTALATGLGNRVPTRGVTS